MNVDGASDVRLNEQAASGTPDAENATEVAVAQLDGPPTDEQVRASEVGDKVEYVSGMRVPQHEPWKPEGRYIKVPIATPGHLQDKFTGERDGATSRIRSVADYDGDGNLNQIPPDNVIDPPYPPGEWREDVVESPRQDEIGNRKHTEYIVVHHTASSVNATIRDIHRGHVQGRGWFDVGYHYVIERDGTLSVGRPENQIGAHVENYNSVSVGVALIGGLKSGGNGKDGEVNFTKAQWATLKRIVTELQQRYPNAQVVAHKDLDRNKPVDTAFDVKQWVSRGMPAISDYPTKIVHRWPDDGYFKA